jgi:5-methylcytosine-specific restriction endonuclease McrA
MHLLTLLRIKTSWRGREWYVEYLRTERWQQKRLAVHKRDGHKCRCCGRCDSALNSFDVHHMSYRYIGREPLRHLVTLCRECHEVVTEVEKCGRAKVVFDD